MVFNGFGTDPFLRDELHGRAEEIMKEPPLFGIEVIEEGDDPGIIEALIAEPLADVCPVLLFDMGVIIFVVSTATGKIDGTFSSAKMSEEVIIEELATVVAIEAEQGEGQSLFDLFDLFEGTRFSFAPDSSLFGPAGGNIDAINGIGEHPVEGVAAMGDGVGFEKAWSGLVPLIGIDRDLSS